MASVTLATMRTRAKSRADMTNSSFVADSEWNAFINASLDDLYDILIQKFGENYYESEQALTTIAGTSDYSLPADFYKLLGVDLVLNSYSVALRQFEFKERNAYKNATFYTGTAPRYRVIANNLRLYPTPASVMTGTIFYVPTRAQLSSDSDAVNYPGSWEDYAVLQATIRALQKEESDVSALLAEQENMVRRIESAAGNRDAGEPAHVSDVHVRMPLRSYFDDEAM